MTKQAPKSTEVAAPKQELEQRKPTISERFLADVEKQFAAEMGGGLQFTALERRLTQHVYLHVDQALKTSESRRNKGTEFSWANVDRQKLALDTVHRVSLGLDALIPNHMHAVFYWNPRTSKYDVSLQIGYVGLDYIARKHAVEPPVDIIYELVYESDEFAPYPRDAQTEVETYTFRIKKPFDRGEPIGGFGYIMYSDPKKNRLVLVTPRDFQRAKNAAKTDKFWKDNDLEMLYKTIVRRVASKIRLDTEKVNAAALAAVTQDELSAEQRAAEDVAVEAVRHANRQLVDVGQGASESSTIDEPSGRAAEAGAQANAPASAEQLTPADAARAADAAEEELERMVDGEEAPMFPEQADF